jgi:hypothetical protein
MSVNRPSAWRLSLRQLLLFVAILAVASCAMQFANEWWKLGLFCFTTIFFLAAAVEAILSRGVRQSFAIGFVVCGGIYLVLVALLGRGELYQFEPGQLPTTQLLRELHSLISGTVYVSGETGERIAESQLTEEQAKLTRKVQSFGSTSTYEQPIWTQAYRLDPGTFLFVGQCLWTLVIACLGGLYGRYAYLRRAATDSRAC